MPYSSHFKQNIHWLRMIPFALLLLTLTFRCGIARAQWTYLGLSHAGLTTNLSIHGDTIYASTHNGIHKKYLHATDTLWTPCGLQGKHVVQTVVRDPLTFISVVEIGSTFKTQIYKTSDGGSTYALLNPDTSNDGAYQFLSAVAHPPASFDTLYFLNHQLKTFDGGITWDTIANLVYNDRFIAVNPLNGQVIIGGETMIMSAYLQLSADHGQTWTMPDMNGYFSGDNCAHDLVINANGWTAVGEGVICRSNDDGDNWTQLLNCWSCPVQWALYLWDIETSPADPNKLYVTGDNWGVGRVPLFYSSDNGVTWDTISHVPAVSPPSMKCLAVKNRLQGDQVFLGGNGVYVYENDFSAIDAPEMRERMMIFPNPAASSVNIQWSSGISHGMLQVLDCFGRIVMESPLAEGQRKEVLRVSELSAGYYLVRISVGDRKFITGKFVVAENDAENFRN